MKLVSIIIVPFMFIVTAKIYSESPSRGTWDMGRHSVATFLYRSSSAQGSLYKTANLFDSNRLTVWMSENKNQAEWVVVDFMEKRLMNRVEVEFPTWALPKLIRYEIQVNIWGKWTTIANNTDPKKKNEHIFKGFDASQIRLLLITQKNSPSAVTDFRVYLGTSLLTGLPSHLTGYRFPIQNGMIPEQDYALPGAPRAYRNGYHKGIDIYEFENRELSKREKLTFDTTIFSIGNGTVIRLDDDYVPMIPEDFEKQKELTKKFPVTYVDRDFGGRQVWIDHGNGVISSYNHMSSIHPELKLGKKVKRNQPIGKTGNSGLLGEAEQNDNNIHLHLEIWIDGEYLGKGLSTKQSRELMEIFFSNNR
ncbi:MAG: M23 family metallopeptidase [Leptospira sp.]|nr:M23 family metallopeptidase [Leptospira sp.]